MKIDTLNVNPCRLKMTVKAEAEETRGDYDQVVQAFVKSGRVPGFRPGKVPVEMVKRVYAKEITEEVNSRVLRTLYKKAVEQEKIKLVNLVNISDVRFSPESGMTAVFELDIEPTFTVPDYAALPVQVETPSVTDEEVGVHVERIREAYAKFEESAADYVAQSKDMVCVDFEGKVAGQPIVEILPSAKSISSAKDYWTQLDEDRFLPELVKAMIGMKAGESKEIEFTFEGEYLPEELKGKAAVYTLAMKTIRSRRLLVDEELCQQMKVENMDKLCEQSKASLLNNKQASEVRRREGAVIEALLKDADFELPESQVSDEVTATLERMAADAQRQGVKPEDLERNRAEIIENATTSAKRQLRLRYILGAIADEKKIDIADADVDAWIAEAATEYRMTAPQLRARVEKNGRMDELRKQIRDQKTLKAIVESLA